MALESVQPVPCVLGLLIRLPLNHLQSPFAYRKISDILTAIGDTVEIEKILKPVYNFKAGSLEK